MSGVGSPPHGTVTFLFTDLEGSTRLFDDHPAGMPAVIARHDELLREAVEAHGGYVVKFTGDGVHAAFPSAAGAVDAAIAAQQSVTAEAWPDPIDIRVRIGLHTGDAVLRDGDYFGAEVNRAARIMSVAHGGQIVCSAAVAELLGDQRDLIDLGQHRLRDLRSTAHLFQITAPGLPAEFAPLRSLDAYPSNLPFELSSFVGREDELRAVEKLLGEARLVSIVGVGGVGKTRLALRVASDVLPHYPDGIWLCELAPVLDTDDLPDAVATAVGYTAPQGVPVAEGLFRFLERKELLVVLDNCEHLVGAVASLVAQVTRAAPRVSVLVTSREPLGVRGEQVLALPSLHLAEDADPVTVLASEAGALFVARAREAGRDLELTAEAAVAVRNVCRRLDGIPLAIELAAAQTTVMTPREIDERLDRQLRVLTGGQRTALARHQTLRAAIDWSYELLGDEEQALLSRLSVCVGGFDLDAATAIAAGFGADDAETLELLGGLVKKSLVERTERDGTTRFRLLEMIRQYAAEQLESVAATADARDIHARHYLDRLVVLFTVLRTDAADAMRMLDAETPNVAAAGRWLLATDRAGELLDTYARLPFVDPWVLPAGTLDELGAIGGDAADQPGTERLAGFSCACNLARFRAFMTGDAATFRHFAERADEAPDAETTAITLIGLVTVTLADGEVDRAIALARRAADCARSTSDPVETALVLSLTAIIEALRDQGRALPIAEEAVAVARTTGSDVTLLYPLWALASAAQSTDPDRTLAAAEECIRLDNTPRRFHSAGIRAAAAAAHIRRGELVPGLTLWREVLRQMARDGERFAFSIQIAALAGQIVDTQPEAAIDLAAIAESDAIAPFAAFTTTSEMAAAGPRLEPLIPAARARAAAMTYDDAMTYVFTTLDELIADHASPSRDATAHAAPSPDTPACP